MYVTVPTPIPIGGGLIGGTVTILDPLGGRIDGLALTGVQPLGITVVALTLIAAGLLMLRSRRIRLATHTSQVQPDTEFSVNKNPGSQETGFNFNKKPRSARHRVQPDRVTQDTGSHKTRGQTRRRVKQETQDVRRG